MDAGVNILCYKSKTLANGAHPLMIRVCKDGKKKYVSLGVSVLPQFWDFTKNQPKKNCPNKAYIEKIIADKSSEFAERIIELKAEKKEFTATTLTEHLTDVQQVLEKNFIVTILFLALSFCVNLRHCTIIYIRQELLWERIFKMLDL